MGASTKSRFASFTVVTILALSSIGAIRAATQPVDLDALPANAAESMCSTDVLNPFPVRIQNQVTNRTNGDAFTFDWPSAGPGGFRSSVTAGTTNGVGATWVWTTDQSIVGFTGNSCPTDVCFTQTSGPDQATSFCSDSCLADGTTVTVRKNGASSVDLSWTGGTSTFTVYRGSTKIGVVAPTNSVGTTNSFVFTDTPPANSNAFYVVRGTDCITRRACTTNADCSGPAEGTCVSRGPFNVPGRSLLANDVTVSAASLTSSLITFFSPPQVVFLATAIGTTGGALETLTSFLPTSIQVTNQAFPPGCCPANSDHPHQMRCRNECIDYLSDPENCGSCGNVCGDGTCCVNGACLSVCGPGQVFCAGTCVFLGSNDQNCGECGNACGEGACCSGGSCHSLCGEGEILCAGTCVDPDYDDAHCGECFNECPDGTCCNLGDCVTVCEPGRTYCGGTGCVDLKNDSDHCGTCGNDCGSNGCCQEGECTSLECNIAPGGWIPCGGQCVHGIHDNQNCGACGNVCPEGTCCNGEGSCNPPCFEGQAQCSDQCTELANDKDHCGSCGNKCDDGFCCDEGTCVSVCDGGRVWCDGQCVDIGYDPANCGSCGNSCGGEDCCSEGECYPYYYECGDPLPPQDPSCPNLTPFTAEPAHCPVDQLPPQPATCPNLGTTNPVEGICPADDAAAAVPTVPTFCPDAPQGGYACPGESPYPAPPVEEAPVCIIPESTTTLLPGVPQTTCIVGGPLFVEVPSAIVVCGDGLPGVDGQCAGAAPKATTGTFNRLRPHPTLSPGNAFVTPFALHVIDDTTGDGNLGPGESGSLLIEVLNAGSMNITGATATLSAPAVDLTNDGIVNPVGLTIGTNAPSFGTILATLPAADCTGPKPIPASNATLIPMTVPLLHPGDTSHPLILTVQGTVGGVPFSMPVPLSLGIADTCNVASGSGDFDGLEGLFTPMAKLVPEEDPVPFPNKAFNGGSTLPLKLRVSCGGVNVTEDLLDPPVIVGLSEAVRGPINITGMSLSDDDPALSRDFFYVEQDLLAGPHWHFNLVTGGLGTGTFTLTIKIGGRKNYVTGFVLR